MNRRDFFKRFGAGAAAVGVGIAVGKGEEPEEPAEPVEQPVSDAKPGLETTHCQAIVEVPFSSLTTSCGFSVASSGGVPRAHFGKNGTITVGTETYRVMDWHALQKQ